MADTKITDLTAATSVAASDILPIVADPGGTPLNKKASKQVFLEPEINLTELTLYDGSNNAALDWSNRQLLDSNEVLSVDWENQQLTSAAYVGVDWQNGTLFDFAYTPLDWLSRVVRDTSDVVSLAWGSRLLQNTTETPVLDWEYGILSDSTYNSLDWVNRYLYDSAAIDAANWDYRILYGSDGVTPTFEWGNPEIPFFTSAKTLKFGNFYTSAPAEELANNQWELYVQEVAGVATLKCRFQNAGGTVKTATVATLT
jgi:hypothetical protein